MTFCEYLVTPRSTDPVVLLAEERIRSRHLRRLVAERDTEIAARERVINELLTP